MVDYIKPVTSCEEQIEILKSRNLIIHNEPQAIQHLKNVGYFRLSGYWLSFYERRDWFKDGTTFEDIMNIYKFDIGLKNLLNDLLGEIEINFRTSISQCFAHEFSPIDHYNSNNFAHEGMYISWFNEFEDQIRKAEKRRELYVTHYISKYDRIFPIWVALEMTSFGDLSKFYSNLNNATKATISRNTTNVHFKYMKNWLYVFAVTRNICAHYSRIYDKRLHICPKLSLQDKASLNIDNSKIFAVIYTAKKMCINDDKWTLFVFQLKELVAEYQDSIDLSKIGFPANWEGILTS
ncbi:Abi family protein [Carnobacterium maltaromaticum]|uniref:Abi family protein n=1 Tax=Carnobacterium maltaromaticum TaxID=2751 RepID=UPI0039BE840E